MLRVIAGIHRGKKIQQPDLGITRPTKDFVKEAIFNKIQFNIRGKIFLDLFSGSGAMGIEAISRGAMKSILVERNADALKVISANLSNLNIQNADTKSMDVLEYLKVNSSMNIDLVYMDPPYKEYELINEILQLLESNKLLNEKFHVFVETDNSNKIVVPKSFLLYKNKKYGKTWVLHLTNNI